jgi:hypothetical protein
MCLLYLQYPTMQLKIKLASPGPKPTTAEPFRDPLNRHSLSPASIIAFAGLPVVLAPGFSRNYTLELDQVMQKEEAQSRIKSLATQGFKAYFLPAHGSGETMYKIRSGLYRGKALALIKGNMLRNKTNLTCAIVELP